MLLWEGTRQLEGTTWMNLTKQYLVREPRQNRVTLWLHLYIVQKQKKLLFC